MRYIQFAEECGIIARGGLLRKLRCIYSDGLCVLDAVGGVGGLAAFLEELHEGVLE